MEESKFHFRRKPSKIYPFILIYESITFINSQGATNKLKRNNDDFYSRILENKVVLIILFL